MSWADLMGAANYIGTLLVTAVAGAIGAYLALCGRNLAMQHDLDRIRSNAQETHTAVQSVEYRYSKEFEVWRHELDYRNQQLEELYGPIYAILSSQIQIFGIWVGGLTQDKNFELKNIFPPRIRKLGT